MPLFEKFPVERELVAQLVQKNYGLVLGEVLKVSQNHTFVATVGSTGEKYVVRATPDPQKKAYERICDELFFCYYLAHAQSLTEVCGPVLPLTSTDAPVLTVTSSNGTTITIKEPSAWAVRVDNLILSVTTWAPGKPVDFMSYRWMTDPTIIKAWGATFARIHNGSKQFTKDFPVISQRMRNWTDVHERIMAPTENTVDPADSVVLQDADKYGILHGDLNVSNFYIDDSNGSHTPTLYCFDWEQCQRGWWEYDVAQASLTVLMLAEAGSLPAGAEPVKEANPEFFYRTIIEGYESVNGIHSLDRERFDRMVQLRKRFYGLFCSQAIVEGVPPEMDWFIKYCNKWVNGSNDDSTSRSSSTSNDSSSDTSNDSSSSSSK